ncbi:MAG: hypothetical protein AB8G95_02220 [Anaerolineae bacterium]
MQNKLKSSIYIESTGSSEQSAYALSANITTRQGFDLHIAAVSQKKLGQFAEIDTPRKTLLSFVTSLQNGGDRSIEKLIHRAVGLVTISTGGYIKRRGGAPCGLAAAILHEDQLYTIKIGAGEVLQCHNEQFSLLTGRKASDLNQAPSGWLGESSQFSLDGINFQKNELAPNSKILVCQPTFLQAVKSNKVAFRDTLTALAKDSEDFANDLARWAIQNGVETGLTMAAHHLRSDGRVKFEEPEAPPVNSQSPTSPPSIERLIDPVAFSFVGIGSNNGRGSDGAELNLGDKLVSKVLFDAQLKNGSDKEKQDDSIEKGSLPFVEIAKEFVEEIVESAAVNDTIRTTAIDISPPAPIRTEGVVKDSFLSQSETARAIPIITGVQAGTVDQSRPQPEAGRYYRLMTITSVGLFLTMVVLGIAVVLQRGVFIPVQARSVEASNQSVAAAPESNVQTDLAASPQQMGVWSQGSESDLLPIFNNEALEARGLIHFLIGNQADGGAKSVYMWPDSKINFDHTSTGTLFALEEDSTLFIDSTQGTIRPELTGLFGVAESSAGCMSVNYRSTSEPLVISCYAGSCRWLGPLNRTFDIPAGERMELDSNLRVASPATFEPIYFTETAVFARTLGGVPTGQAIANQCLEPYLAEGQQLTADQTSTVAGAMSLNVAKEIGYWRIGNSPNSNELGRGETVSIRGLTHFTLQASVDNQTTEHSVYAWPGSELHFDPELDENQFDVAGGSALFLDSTDSVIRPFFPDLFGTAESSDGCMAITFPSATKPLALSCYSGTCSWNGALNRNYNIPIGQRLELASNPRVENPAVLEPIRRTETAVVARTLGSIPAGLEISNRCVEPYLINPERVIVVPLATSTPEPTAEPTVQQPTPPTFETPVEIFEETPDGITDESDAVEGELIGTPEPEAEATPNNLFGS